jgi:C4-dicarboxylate-specific signal transduction histidine kinase
LRTRNIEDQVQVAVRLRAGLDPNGIEKLFDPFYTTKASGIRHKLPLPFHRAAS